MKYPIGIQTFEVIRQDGFVYVDKTALIHRLVTEGRVYFLSRPRRFGKSLLLSTLKAYFEGRRELFSGLAIEKMETEWATHPVFHIDFNSENFTQEGVLKKALLAHITLWESTYGPTPKEMTVGTRFRLLLAKAYEQTGRKAVVLVDEYDKPLLDVLDTPLEEVNRNILKAFYSTFKAADPCLQFVMLTGVTKFSQVSVFSGFNQPNDISMSTKYEAICGITQEELNQYFSTSLRELAEVEHLGLEEMKQEFKRQYDGYHFSRNMLGIYNPFSVLRAFAEPGLGDYWYATGSPSYLVRLMEHFNENIEDMVSRYYPTSQFVDYRADVERPLPMLYQSGYLTIKDYNPRVRTYRLDFPNSEVTAGFVTMLANRYLSPSEGAESWIARLVDALRLGQLETVRVELTSFFAGIPYSLRRKQGSEEQERDFQYSFFLVMRMISAYAVLAEHQQSQGRADCVVLTPDYVYIFEFKRDGTARQAIDQIHTAGYAREYQADPRPVYLIGCNFSTLTGTIDDWAVEGA